MTRRGKWRLGLWAGIAVIVGAVLVFSAMRPANTYDSLAAVPIEKVPARQWNGAEKPRIGVAFGGGGVRGFMHLGAIKALDEAGIRADVVTGSSAGAIAAALYATGKPYVELEQIAMSARNVDFADLALKRQGLINGQALARWVNNAIDHRRFADMAMPLGITVTDLTGNRALLVVDGDVGRAAQASASIPGTFVPVTSGDAVWVDGAILTIVPVKFARALGADRVIAIDIYCGNQPTPKFNAVDTVVQAVRLQSCTLGRDDMAEADMLVRPEFEPKNPLSFRERQAAIDAGYHAMKAMLDAHPDWRARARVKN